MELEYIKTKNHDLIIDSHGESYLLYKDSININGNYLSKNDLKFIMEKMESIKNE